jgi:glycosyltransferase involved in cell wall biosynthesis
MPSDHSAFVSSVPLRFIQNISRRVANRFVARTEDQSSLPEAKKVVSPPIRVAQIVAAASHSPWFTNICSEMAGRGFEIVAIIDSSEGDLAGRLTASGIRYYKVPLYFGGNLDRARLPLYVLSLPIIIGRIAWILRRERIDIAHSHVFVANFAARFACLLARTRHVAGIAGPRHLEAGVTRMTERLTCRADDLIVGGCEYIATLYRRLDVADDRIACVYYGSPAENFDPAAEDQLAFRRELGIADDTPLVGLVAHFYPPMRGPQAPQATRGVGLKGHDTFLDAARIVARRFPEARFVLVGSGSNDLGERYRQSLIESCRADGFIEKVFFVNHRHDLQRVLVSFDVAVQCALTECLGGTVEALLMERPTVATRVGGMPEAVRHEETGLLVPSADPASLAAAIERLLGDRGEAQRFARAGRALMLERFTLARTGSDLASLYARVTGAGRC